MKKLIKKILREEFEDDFDWIRNIPGEIPEIDDENKFLMLVNILGIDEVFGDVIGFDDPDTDFVQNSWKYYEIDTFTLNNGDHWAVGTKSEFDFALSDYWSNFTDEVGVESIDNFEDYITMTDTDRRLFAQDMANNYVEDLSDEDVIEYTGYDDDWNELEDKIGELEEERDGIDTSIDDQISNLELKKDNLINAAREVVREEDYDRWYECLADPYECLVNEHGFYMNGRDLLGSTTFHFDNKKFTEYMVNQSDWGSLSHYDEIFYEEGDYVAIRLD